MVEGQMVKSFVRSGLVDAAVRNAPEQISVISHPTLRRTGGFGSFDDHSPR
jgi:hypothetical protein